MKTLKKKALLLAALMLTPGWAMAQLAPQIVGVPVRNTFSLDGNWKSIVDPFENGYYDYRLSPTDNGYAQDVTYDDFTKLQEYDFETNAELKVPGDWNTQRPQLYYYEGTVWYRKRFDYKPKPGKRLFLHFGAANYESIVWLNGKRLGQHVGGFTPFNFEVTDIVRQGMNSLVVKVDNRRHPEGVPTVNTDWWNYGGITRSVNLVETPATFIRDYYAQLSEGNKQLIEGYVQLDGKNLSEQVTLEIPELKVKTTVTADQNGLAKFSIKAKPELWSPENPRLYSVTWKSASDEITDEVGFRTIRTEGTKLLLNDKEIFCRGISIHEESAFGNNGRAYSPEQDRILLQWAKDLGCNFVRLAHYPHNEYMVREAQRMGLLVWSEIPVYWTIHWDNPDTYKNAESQLADMITRDRNRCNIIIWSIANETPHSDARLKFLTNLANKVREMDGHNRLVGAAMEVHNITDNHLTVRDELSKVLDLISFNEYVGWYNGSTEHCDEVNWSFGEEKPVFISEWGGGALYGHHGSSKLRFTEEYQAEMYAHHIEMLKRMPGLAGTTPWILKDFRSPRRQVPHIQDDYNRKGIVSDTGFKKQAFFVLQKWYEELKKKY